MFVQFKKYAWSVLRTAALSYSPGLNSHEAAKLIVRHCLCFQQGRKTLVWLWFESYVACSKMPSENAKNSSAGNFEDNRADNLEKTDHTRSERKKYQSIHEKFTGKFYHTSMYSLRTSLGPSTMLFFKWTLISVTQGSYLQCIIIFTRLQSKAGQPFHLLYFI